MCQLIHLSLLFLMTPPPLATQLKIHGNESGADTIHTRAENSVQTSQENHRDGKVAVEGELGDKLDELLTRYQMHGLSGTFLVAQDDRIVLHKGYGLADRERKIPNMTATLFEMGSLTKTFTAAAILRLEMQGKLKTSDSISKHLGEFPKPKDGATIHQLLTHTAGLVVEGTPVGGDGVDRERFIQDMKDTPMESPPGEKYRYTNAGYSVLAAIIEKASGQSYESYLREQLFKPARLQNLGFRGDFDREDRRRARGYLGTLERIEEGPPLTYLWGTRGAGGIITTVAEMYKWHLALQGAQILSATAKEKTFYPWPNEGYGWHVETDKRGRKLIHKGGGQVNFATQVLFYPDERLVVVWASNNLQQRWRRALNSAIPGVVFGEEYVLPPTVAPLDSGSMQRYVGKYTTSAGDSIEIKSKENYLFVTENRFSLPTSVPFLPQSLIAFTGFDAPNLRLLALRFDVNPARSVRGLIVSLANQNVSLGKIAKQE